MNFEDWKNFKIEGDVKEFVNKNILKDVIYLDYNATTPVHPLVALETSKSLFSVFGNPSSNHTYGHEANKAIETARGRVADLLNCESDCIIFNSGGTESNNHSIFGGAMWKKKKEGRNEIVTSSFEHPSVMHVCEYLKNDHGFVLKVIDVDSKGNLDLEMLEKNVNEKTAIVSVMLANNEVGTIQNVERVGNISKKHGSLFHSDASQAVGKMVIDMKSKTFENVDLLTLAAHKFYCPKGIGALYIKKNVELIKYMNGASHEKNIRAGTLNTHYITALGLAAKLLKEEMKENIEHISLTRNFLKQKFLERFPNVARVNGNEESMLCNTLSISFKGVISNEVINKICDRVAVSSGSACHSHTISMSSVLKVMKVEEEYGLGTFRISTGKFLTMEQAEKAYEIISKEVENYLSKK
eukprot:TRINITY_DN7112_c0_g1_i1.p1 TRINITY_DN7112_c0_g1~~TRINITY_DN7112_c0_g1_i1.p1  ORF type:complete len:412 (-),score=104.99 TRINITY_DN7112_c0_g1_i1:19-1254(-)